MERNELLRPFPLGEIVITPAAKDALYPEDWVIGLCRHNKGDGGECCTEDAAENEFSLKEGFRLLSVYRDRNGVKFWIITEADRSVTTVLLPEEY